MAHAGDLDEALILAPLRKDASLLTDLLETSGIAAPVCDGADGLGRRLGGRRPGVLVLTQEALTEAVVDTVAKHLEAQPQWSELPIIVLVEAGAVRTSLPTLLAERWQRSRHVFYQRPVSRLELLSGIQSALLARLRQKDVRDYLDLERELRHELNHRVKNILASVNSIFRMTVRNSDSLEALDSNFSGRLETLGRVHSALFETGGEKIALEYLVSLVLAPYTSRGGSSFQAEGPSVDLDKDAAASLGLVLHELVTNAIKYGAWSVAGGRIGLNWDVRDDRFRLVWRETGGPALARPTSSGYGTRYIKRALKGQFGEEPDLKFDPEGLVVVMQGPLSRILAEEKRRNETPQTSLSE